MEEILGLQGVGGKVVGYLPFGPARFILRTLSKRTWISVDRIEVSPSELLDVIVEQHINPDRIRLAIDTDSSVQIVAKMYEEWPRRKRSPHLKDLLRFEDKLKTLPTHILRAMEQDFFCLGEDSRLSRLSRLILPEQRKDSMKFSGLIDLSLSPDAEDFIHRYLSVIYRPQAEASWVHLIRESIRAGLRVCFGILLKESKISGASMFLNDIVRYGDCEWVRSFMRANRHRIDRSRLVHAGNMAISVKHSLELFEAVRTGVRDRSYLYRHQGINWYTLMCLQTEPGLEFVERMRLGDDPDSVSLERALMRGFWTCASYLKTRNFRLPEKIEQVLNGPLGSDLELFKLHMLSGWTDLVPVIRLLKSRLDWILIMPQCKDEIKKFLIAYLERPLESVWDAVWGSVLSGSTGLCVVADLIAWLVDSEPSLRDRSVLHWNPLGIVDKYIARDRVIWTRELQPTTQSDFNMILTAFDGQHRYDSSRPDANNPWKETQPDPVDLAAVHRLRNVFKDQSVFAPDALIALMKQSKHHNENAIEYLLANGVDINHVSNGETALSIVAGSNNVSSFSYFLHRGALVHPPSGPSVLVSISNAKLSAEFRTAIAKYDHVVQLVNELDCTGFAPLHFMLTYGRMDEVDWILNMNADVNVSTRVSQFTCAMLCVMFQETSQRRGHLDKILARKADVDARDIFGRTALFYAVLLDARPSFQKLIAHGANMEIRDQYGVSPLDLACNLVQLTSKYSVSVVVEHVPRGSRTYPCTIDAGFAAIVRAASPADIGNVLVIPQKELVERYNLKLH